MDLNVGQQSMHHAFRRVSDTSRARRRYKTADGIPPNSLHFPELGQFDRIQFFHYGTIEVNATAPQRSGAAFGHSHGRRRQSLNLNWVPVALISIFVQFVTRSINRKKDASCSSGRARRGRRGGCSLLGAGGGRGERWRYGGGIGWRHRCISESVICCLPWLGGSRRS